MDSILTLSTPHRHLEIPFFGRDIYDNVDFYNYPVRQGWDIVHLRNGNYGQRSSIDAASFTQAWLFFGTISEVTATAVRGANFIRVSESDGSLIITTERLHFYLDIWRWRATSATRSDVQKRATRERAKECLDAVVRLTTPGLLVPEHPEVAVSIDILLVVLVDTFQELYGLEAWNARSFFSFNAEDRNTLPGANQDVNKYLQTRMVAQGWCPHRLASFAGGFRSDTLYMLSLMGTRDLLSGHDRCTEDVCVGNHVDERAYNETPRHVRHGCDCGFLMVDVGKAIRAIEQGQIPLATVVMDSERHVCLEITPHKPGMTYIAISHVWAHGLGNPDNNALRICQLLDLDKLLRSTLEDQGLGDTSTDTETVYFWIDTLCLPLRPPHARRAGIMQMRRCYEAAAAVLVLDKHLRRSTIYTPSRTTEPLLQVAISDWRFRVWTLQEATFAKKLIFQFLDGQIDANELLRLHFLNPGVNEITNLNGFVTVNLLPALGYDSFGPNGGELRAGHISLLSLVWSLQGRSISKPEDEPLCLASLLGQDSILSAILECQKEDRMKGFWRTLGDIPAWVPFIGGPKMEEAGYRWAPSTLRLRVQALGWFPGESHFSPTVSHKLQALGWLPSGPDGPAEFKPDGPGLMVIKPGFLLLEQEDNTNVVEAIDYAFRIRDDRGHCYDVERSWDKFNPELPELGENIAVIVGQWTKTHYPPVLIVSITKQDQDQGQESGLFRCRILCRGIIIAEETFPREVFAADSIISYRARRVREDQSWLLE